MQKIRVLQETMTTTETPNEKLNNKSPLIATQNSISTKLTAIYLAYGTSLCYHWVCNVHDNVKWNKIRNALYNLKHDLWLHYSKQSLVDTKIYTNSRKEDKNKFNSRTFHFFSFNSTPSCMHVYLLTVLI